MTNPADVSAASAADNKGTERGSGTAAASASASGLEKVLATIVERLKEPALQFGLGAGILLLLLAGLNMGSQAPLYVAALIVVLIAALVVYAKTAGAMTTSAVKASRTDLHADAGGNMQVGKDAVVAGAEQTGTGSPSDIHTTVHAGKDMIVGEGGNVGGVRIRSQDPKDAQKPER